MAVAAAERRFTPAPFFSSPKHHEHRPAPSTPRLFRKLSYELHHHHEKAAIPHFNTFFLERRFKELQQSSANKTEAMHQLKKLARRDFECWAKEYVLHAETDTFSYSIKQTPDGALAITDEYNHHLLAMTQHAIDEYARRGDPTTRMEADAIAHARMMQWDTHPNRKPGDKAINISPHAEDTHPHYPRYSYVFLREKGSDTIHTTQLKSWQSHTDLVRALRELGCSLPNNADRANGEEIASWFFPIDQSIEAETVRKILRKFPERTAVPNHMREVQLSQPTQIEHYAQSYAIAEQFFLKVVEEQYAQTTDWVRANRIIEEAVNFSFRFLTKNTTESSFAATSVNLQSANPQLSNPQTELYSSFMKYVDHKYHHKKLTQHEASVLQASLTGVLGNLGKVLSVGDCGAGTMLNIATHSSLTAAPNMLRGISPEILGKTFDSFSLENCPFCQRAVQALKTIDGRIICPGCGNTKMCGNEGKNNGKSHSSLFRTPSPARTESQQSHHQPQESAYARQLIHQVAAQSPVDALLFSLWF